LIVRTVMKIEFAKVDSISLGRRFLSTQNVQTLKLTSPRLRLDFHWLSSFRPRFPFSCALIMLPRRIPIFLLGPPRLLCPRQCLRQWTAKRHQSSQPSYKPPTAPQQGQPVNPHVCCIFRLILVYGEANLYYREPSTSLSVCHSQKFSSERCARTKLFTGHG